MFLPNDKTALCSGQPWKSCRRLGSTPGLPAASLSAAHPRAAAAVRGPRRPSRFRGPGTRRARGTVPLRQVERAATPGRARRSVGEELRKGKAPPAGEGIPSARRSRPPPPPRPARKRRGSAESGREGNSVPASGTGWPARISGSGERPQRSGRRGPAPSPGSPRPRARRAARRAPAPEPQLRSRRFRPLRVQGREEPRELEMPISVAKLYG